MLLRCGLHGGAIRQLPSLRHFQSRRIATICAAQVRRTAGMHACAWLMGLHAATSEAQSSWSPHTQMVQPGCLAQVDEHVFQVSQTDFASKVRGW